MLSVRKGFVIRLIPALLAALLLISALPAAGLAEEAMAQHNYILVIDNSRSTTGRHSLGEATDPKGLRFDAARLVYQNVLSSGKDGQLGVIVFCGPKNCVSYGPMDVHDPNLDAEIGDNLNAEANKNRRDAYTDIRTALQTALSMMTGFEGQTSVILLSDGVNDLSNKSDPFSRPENIKANDESVALVEAIHGAGADFHVIALTTQADVTADDPFMAFINRLADAGGGEPGEDGSYNNVLVATQADVESKLLQLLIRAESASQTIQTIVGNTPVQGTFTVPYTGITDATVNITFMPEDKARLQSVALISPGGQTWTLWEGGAAQEADGIAVTEDRSYIMLTVPSPEAGEWGVAVAGRQNASGNDSAVSINAITRFNHNLRMAVDVPGPVFVGEEAEISAWFRTFDGTAFHDLTDSDIYSQSTAAIVLTAPSGKAWDYAMKRQGERYVIRFIPKSVGTWTARVEVKNPYLQHTADEEALEVIERPTPTPEPAPVVDGTPVPTPEPTPTPAPVDPSGVIPTPTPSPTPTPTPTPVPTVVPLESVGLKVSPTIKRAGQALVPSYVRYITVAWNAGEVDSLEAELLEDGEHVRDLEFGDRIECAGLKSDAEYAVRVSAMPLYGTVNDAEPCVETSTFRLAPEVGELGNIALSVAPLMPDTGDALYVDRRVDQVTFSWEVDGEADSVQATLQENGVDIMTLTPGEGVDIATFKDDAEYALCVTAMPINGALMGAEPETQALSFRLYPKAEPVTGLNIDVADATLEDDVYCLKGAEARLSWRHDGGEVDHYELTVTGGGTVIQQTLTGTEYRFTASQKGDCTVRVVATPRYALSDADCTEARVVVRPHIRGFVERYWPFGLGLIALLIGLIVALALLRASRAEHVTGKLRVVCEALDIDATLSFTDDIRGVKLDSPLTAHRELKKLKGKKGYALLSRVRVNMALANSFGGVSAKNVAPETAERIAEVRHRPNEKLIVLTYKDPKTGKQDMCYVGKYDIGKSAMTIEDGGTAYEFLFSAR